MAAAGTHWASLAAVITGQSEGNALNALRPTTPVQDIPPSARVLRNAVGMVRGWWGVRGPVPMGLL